MGEIVQALVEQGMLAPDAGVGVGARRAVPLPRTGSYQEIIIHPALTTALTGREIALYEVMSKRSINT